MKLRYTLPALADLNSVLDYIAAHSPRGAQRVHARKPRSSSTPFVTRRVIQPACRAGADKHRTETPHQVGSIRLSTAGWYFSPLPACSDAFNRCIVSSAPGTASPEATAISSAYDRSLIA